MENVAAVIGRMSELTMSLESFPLRPASGFSQVLDAAMGTGPTALGARPATSQFPPAPPGLYQGLGGAATVTLGHMTGSGSQISSPINPATSGWTMPVVGRVGSQYGPRFSHRHDEVRMHHGVDIAAPTGTAIQAARDGVVTFAGDRGGFGNLVIVDHGGGTETYYAHQSQILVAPGQTVAAGSIIGLVGSTGVSDIPHLHFEVRHGGQPVDPAPYLGVG